ncbi:MAG: EAL domain-containing protein [Lachnospiraceae bacterium]|nr:EAL domain-containing protein [Lachnospiraceae bacterium]
MILVHLFNKEITKKSRVITIIISCLIYMLMSFALRINSVEPNDFLINQVEIKGFVLRGVITQVQILVSVYIVLKLNKEGYITALVLNTYSLFMAVFFLIRSRTVDSLPGVISYIAVMIIITLIMEFKNQVFHYLKKIEDQKIDLEISKQKLYDLAYYDPVTRLANMKLYIEELKESIKEAGQENRHIAVVCIDLDSFKTINDTMGYYAGNDVLSEFADRFIRVLNDNALVSRSGGDEYFILLRDMETVEELKAAVKDLMCIFNRSVKINGIDFHITGSVGVSVFPYDGEEADQLIKNANLAMFEAKNNGKNKVIFCTNEMKEVVNRKMILTNHLYQALEKHELFLHFQPQIAAEDRKINGFEALIRWNHPTMGLISPGEFIPIAEQTGLIKPIGLWVFRQACEECMQCDSEEKEQIRIAINLSMEQLREVNIVKQFHKIIKEIGIEANKIEIEITESIAFNKEFDVLHVLNELKRVGFLIAIDDFGKEYSSLNRIRSFPVDRLKIDMDFVHGISSGNHKDRAVVKTIIQLAKNLGVKVLAEGVETQEQYQFLKEHGCDEMQGFFFHKGMTAQEAGNLLAGKRK